VSTVGQLERKTQKHVVELFRDQLGYEYLGDWDERPGNANVEERLLRQNLLARGYSDEQVTRAVHELVTAADIGSTQSLYDANRKVYSLLRYGVPVQTTVEEQTETVSLIDWIHPDANHFGIAEEVSIKGEHNKRPDLVLYVNGIAIGVIELKFADTG